MLENNRSERDSAQIMVVEDAPGSLKLMVKILQGFGYHVRPANTGELAMASVDKAPPDLILLDIKLPGIDGYEVCKRIKSNPNTRDIPVIFISALENYHDKLLGFEAGAVDFITKPYEPNEVLARVSTHLKLHFLHKNLEHSNAILAAEIERRKNAEEALLREKESFRITLLSIGDGVITTDHLGKITLMNDVAAKLTGWTAESGIGKPFGDIFNIINEQTRQKCADPIRTVIAKGKTLNLSSQTIMINKNGSEIPIADSAAPIFDSDNRISGAVLVFRDITIEKIKQDKSEYLSFHDQLTGLGNRRFFEEQISSLNNASTLPLTIIMGDVNGLKLTNDAFGHQMGDKLLQKAAEVLNICCRKSDIICRHGGDEFVIFLPNTNAAIAENIVTRIRQTALISTLELVPLSISLGWSVRKTLAENINDTVKKAEEYMYRRKLQESHGTRGDLIKTIMNTLAHEYKNEQIHSELAGKLCRTVAAVFNLSYDESELYKTVCMFHDIGKIAIDKTILQKKSKLSDKELAVVKRHPEVGYRILNSVPEYAAIAEFVLAHHERWDGLGYPNSLAGEAIPFVSRMIAIVDAYVAMVSERPYRKTLTEDEAAREIINNAGSQFDPEIARIFVEKVLDKPWDSTLA